VDQQAMEVAIKVLMVIINTEVMGNIAFIVDLLQLVVVQEVLTENMKDKKQLTIA